MIVNLVQMSCDHYKNSAIQALSATIMLFLQSLNPPDHRLPLHE